LAESDPAIIEEYLKSKSAASLKPDSLGLTEILREFEAAKDQTPEKVISEQPEAPVEEQEEARPAEPDLTEKSLEELEAELKAEFQRQRLSTEKALELDEEAEAPLERSCSIKVPNPFSIQRTSVNDNRKSSSTIWYSNWGRGISDAAEADIR